MQLSNFRHIDSHMVILVKGSNRALLLFLFKESVPKPLYFVLDACKIG